MTLGQAVVHGIVQGLTEFLPISSTAHLYVVPQLLGWVKPDTAFVAVIQLGTLAAVFAYFARDIAAITKATLAPVFGCSRPTVSGRGGEGTATERRGYNPQLGWMIALGTVPVVVLGLLFKDQIETTLTSLYVIAGAMIGLAFVLALAEWLTRRRAALRGMERVGWWDAVAVGLAQAVALIPGSSRCGCTIAGGLFMGFDRETAARFSFLLSLPAVLGAGLFELKHALHAPHSDPVSLVLATLVSGVVGYASIAFLLGYLKKHTMWLFIIYRLALGGLLLALLHLGKLTP
jgi:undecaprenyl-diphosphatase